MAGVCNGEYFGHSPGDEPLTLMRCNSSRLSQLFETLKDGVLFVAKPATLGIKGKFSFFFYFVYLLLFYYPSFLGMMRPDPTLVGCIE